MAGKSFVLALNKWMEMQSCPKLINSMLIPRICFLKDYKKVQLNAGYLQIEIFSRIKPTTDIIVN